jgi:ABC-type uncharacterized transport system involved in gliding motility auxiliary subunit
MAFKRGAGHFMSTLALHIQMALLLTLLPLATSLATNTTTTAAAARGSSPTSRLHTTTKPSLLPNTATAATPFPSNNTNNTNNISAITPALEQTKQTTNSTTITTARSLNISDKIALGVGLPVGILTLFGMIWSGWMQRRSLQFQLRSLQFQLTQLRQMKEVRSRRYRRYGVNSIRLHSGSSEEAAEMGLAL